LPFLIVDDNESLRTLVKTLLIREGFMMISSKILIKEAIGSNMPTIDVFEFPRRIRHFPVSKRVLSYSQ
jgi:CheY-like chemotaxis protein